MEHTPLPWIAKMDSLHHEWFYLMFEDKSKGGIHTKRLDNLGAYHENDAALIVRAVNCHEELLALVKRLRDLTFSEHGARTHMTLDVDQAIAKAEGK